MAEEDRQTEMALMPPRVEDQERSPRTEPGQGLDPLEFARGSFESAVERFNSAGDADLDPEDPALYNAYRRSLDYLGDMALGGLELSDAAFRAAVGIAAQALPEDQERRFARDLAGMPEAFMGFSPARIAQATDEVVEGVGQIGRNLTRRDEMPVLGSNLGNVGVISEEPSRTSGRVTNPLFRANDNTTQPEVGTRLLNFYSPLRSTLEQMPIARDGSTGETIMAYLNKRAPNLSSSEIRYSQLDLEPTRRYTREELLEELDRSGRDTSTITAEMLTGSETAYRKIQRQGVTDREEGYFEVVLENPSVQTPSGLPIHYTRNTVAHSRSSIRSDDSGEYILIEELQSDSLQTLNKKIASDSLEDLQDSDGVNYIVQSVRDELDYIDASVNDEALEFAISDMYEPTRSVEEIKDWYKDNFEIEVNGNTRWSFHLDALRKLSPDVENKDLDDLLLASFDEASERGQEFLRSMSSLEDVPFDSNTQYVKNLILANIAEAKNEGITRIVIPSVEEIARLRAGTGDFPDMESAVRALRPTYVDAVRKAVNTLNNEANGTIRVGTQTLEYPTAVAGERTRRATGTLLDISDFEFDPQTQAARFAEGGLAMEEQMRLFEEGGLSDDGMNMDPVSGNEVPSGSMAEEVRDDIPAQLSEGEYVVPADVVRYYGVKFFEDLRSDAKMGLNQMERDGRIGGEPVNAPMGSSELSPEEMQMIQEITGMAEGGMVNPQYSAPVAAATNPTNPGSQMYDPMAMQGMYNKPRGFSNGGMPGVANMSQEDFFNMAQAASQYQLPSSIFTSSQEEGAAEPTRTVTLYGPNNEEIVLTLPADQPTYDSLISQGYTTEMKDLGVVTTQQTDQDFEGGLGIETPDIDREILSEEDLEALRSNPLSFGMETLESGGFLTGPTGAGVGALLGGPGMLIGGVVGTAMELNNIAKARASLQLAESQGLSDTEEYTALQESINTAVSSLTPFGRFLERLGVGSGSRILEQAQGDEDQINPPGLRDDGFLVTPQPRPDVTSTAETRRDPSRDDDSGPSTSGVMDAINRLKDQQASEAREQTRSEAARSVAEAEGNVQPDGSTRRTTDFGKETLASKVQRGGGFKEGGLVNKPKRKSRKK